MFFDIHSHMYSDAYIDFLESIGSEDRWMTRRRANSQIGFEPSARVAEMDAAGVDLQVLSMFPTVPAMATEADAVKAARLINDEYADVIASHPGRFAAFAALPMPHIDAAVEEAARCASTPEFVGVALPTSIGPITLADPLLDPLWRALSDWGTTAFLHPVGECPQVLHDLRATWTFGSPIEDTIAVAALLTAAVPRRFPGLRIINSHAGGALAMLLARLDSHPHHAPGPDAETATETARRMWFDTVLHRSVATMRFAAEVLGSDRMVFGSDYPVVRADDYSTATGLFREAYGQAADAIAEQNILAAVPGLAVLRT